jgi:hypothetical protein
MLNDPSARLTQLACEGSRDFGATQGISEPGDALRENEAFPAMQLRRDDPRQSAESGTPPPLCLRISAKAALALCEGLLVDCAEETGERRVGSQREHAAVDKKELRVLRGRQRAGRRKPTELDALSLKLDCNRVIVVSRDHNDGSSVIRGLQLRAGSSLTCQALESTPETFTLIAPPSRLSLALGRARAVPDA